MTKTYNMTFTDAQLDLIFDALNLVQDEFEDADELMNVISAQVIENEKNA
jgi:hypothetical protein